MANFNNTRDHTSLDELQVRENGFSHVEYLLLQIMKSMRGEVARCNKKTVLNSEFRNDFENLVRVFLNAWDIEFSDSEVEQATNLYCTEENYLRIRDSQEILTSVFYN